MSEQDQSAGPQSGSAGAILKMILAAALSLAAVSVAFVLLILVFVGTPVGRNTIAGFINDIEGIEHGGISGQLLSSFQIKDLRISDSKTVWLTADDISVDWTPLSLLRRKASIRAIKSSRITVLKAPEYVSEEAAEPFKVSDITDIPVSVALDTLDVDQIIWKGTQGREDIVRLAATAILKRQEALTAALALEPLTTPMTDDEVNADIVLNTADKSAALKLDLTADENGLIASLAGLPGRTTADVEGSGTLKAWSGKAEVLVSSINVVDLTTQFNAPSGTLTGSINPAPFVPEDTTDMLSEPFNVDTQFETQAGERLALTGSISNGAAQLDLAGKLRTLDGILSGEDFGLTLRADGQAGPAQLKGARAELVFNGDTASPDIAYTVSTTSVSVDAITVGPTKLDGRVATTDDVQSVTVSGLVESVTGVDAVAPSVLEAIKIDGRVRLNEGLTGTASVKNETFELNVDDITQDADGTLRLNATVLADSLADLPANIPAQLQSAVSIVQSPDGGLSAAIKGTVSPQDSTAHWISRTASKALAFDITAAQSAAGDLSVESLQLSSDKVDVTAAAQLTDDRVSADVKGTIQPAAFEDVAGTPVTSPATFNLKADGPLVTVMPRGTVSIPAFKAASLLFRDMSIDLAPSQDGDQTLINLSGVSSGGPVMANAAISRFEDGSTAIEALSARLANVAAEGNISLPGDPEALPNGRLIASLLPAPAGSDGLFGLSGRFDINADLPETSSQPIELKGQGDFLRLGPEDAPSFQISALALDGTIDMSSDAPKPNVTFSAEALEAGALFIDRIALDATTIDGAPEVIALIEQAGEKATALEITTRIETLDAADAVPTTRVTIAPAGLLSGQSVSAPNPIEIAVKGDTTTIKPAQVVIGQSTLSLSAQQSPSALEATLALSAFQIRTITDLLHKAPVTGQLDVELDLSADPGSGILDGTFTVADLRAGGEKPVTLGLSGSLNADTDTLTLTTQAGPNNAPKEADILLKLPIVWPDQPGVPAPAPDALADGNVTIDTRLAPWWALAGMNDQVVQGRLVADIALSGPLDAIKPDGQIALSEARYENLEFGTRLENLKANVSLSGDTVSLDTLSADDGRGGTLDATAELKISPDVVPLNSQVSLKDFQAIAKEGLEARIGATLALDKRDDNLLLNGDVVIEEARYAIAATGGPSVTTLPIQEVNSNFLSDSAAISQDEEDTPPEPEVEADHLPLVLDINVKAPRRIFVTGMGLTSEWQTQLDVEGYADEPSVSGSISLERGELEFAGKRFNLERGQIFLDDSPAQEPRLDILAANTQGDFTAQIGITGTPSDPNISLSSTPALPDDEILSRILFGTSASDLGALEAVQLASALASLSGGGGSGALDVAGKARSITGLDRLSLGSAESSTSITGGKYLSEDLYLQFTTDPSNGQYLAAIEWYLTRTLSLLSEYGAQTGSNVAARWSRNY